MEMIDRGLSEEQRLMRETCRGFVNDLVIPSCPQLAARMADGSRRRLPREILEQADRIGIRTLGVPRSWRHPARPGQRGADLRSSFFRGDRARPTRACRQAGAGLEGVGAAAQHRAALSAGAWFPKLVADPAFLLGAFASPSRVGFGSLAALNVPEAAMNTKAVLKGGEWVINAASIHQQRL